MNTSNKGFSVASLVLGIIAAATGIFYIISLPAGIVGIILGSVSLKKKLDGRGLALAGLVTSIVGTAFGALVATVALIVYVAHH